MKFGCWLEADRGGETDTKLAGGLGIPVDVAASMVLKGAEDEVRLYDGIGMGAGATRGGELE